MTSPPTDPYLRKLWFRYEQDRPVGPHTGGRSRCGCYGDPWVFGHFRPYGCQGGGVIG